MQWTEDLSIGVDLIDNEHKELFNKINHLVTAIKGATCKYTIDGTIKFLEDYAALHFTDEERCMEEAGYAELPAHRGHHAHFLKALAELRRQAALPRVPGASYELSVTTNQVVVDWIVDHIMKVDKRFGEYLQAGGRRK